MTILDRYLIREIVLPFVLVAGRAHVRPGDPADPREREAAHRQGRRVDDHRAGAAHAAAAGAQPDDPDGRAAGHLIGFGRLSADREFVAHAGLRRQPDAAAPAGGARRGAGHRGDGLRDDRRAAGRQPDLPRDHLRRRGRRASRSNVKPRVFFEDFPQPRHLRPRHCRRRRLAGRLPRRHRRDAGADDGLLRRGRADPSRPREAARAAGTDRRHEPHDLRRASPTTYEGSDLRAHHRSPSTRSRVPASAAEGRRPR